MPKGLTRLEEHFGGALADDWKLVAEEWSHTTQYDQDMGAALFADGRTVLSAHEWDQQPTENRLKLMAQAPVFALELLRVLTGDVDSAAISKALREAGILR